MNFIPSPPRAAKVAAAALGLLLLLFILLSPTVTADDEPPRLNAAVFTVTQPDSVETATVLTCLRWLAGSGGDGYTINVYGVATAVSTQDVPFRPGWLMPSPDDCIELFPFPDEELSVSVSTTLSGTPIATSCNITIRAQPYYAGGFTPGSSHSCGTPAYTHDISLSGTTEVSGTDVTFHLNHTLASPNATMYQYQYSVAGIPSWFNLDPTSSFTFGAANFTQPANLSGYRLVNFTFSGVAGEADDSNIIWRVRAVDTFTVETGQWSCQLDLPTVEGFSKSCRPPRVSGIDEDTPSLPFVDVQGFSDALGVSLAIGAGILAGAYIFLFAGLTTFIGRDVVSATAGALLGVVLSFQAALLPGWIVLLSFYAATVITMQRFIED